MAVSYNKSVLRHNSALSLVPRHVDVVWQRRVVVKRLTRLSFWTLPAQSQFGLRHISCSATRLARDTARSCSKINNNINNNIIKKMNDNARLPVLTKTNTATNKWENCYLIFWKRHVQTPSKDENKNKENNIMDNIHTSRLTSQFHAMATMAYRYAREVASIFRGSMHGAWKNNADRTTFETALSRFSDGMVHAIELKLRFRTS